MAIFPQDLKPLQAGYAANKEENVARNDAGQGQVQERDNWNRVRYVGEADFKHTTFNVERIMNFWEINRGLPFDWFDYEWSTPKAVVQVGVGDGVTTTWTLPAKSLRTATLAVGTVVLYFNGVAQPAGNVSILLGTGPKTQDQVHSTVAAGAGVIVTVMPTLWRALYSVRFRAVPRKQTTGPNRQAIHVEVYEDFG